MKPLLKLSQARNLLNVGKDVLDKLISTGEVVAIEIGSNPKRRTLRVRPEAIDDYLVRQAGVSGPRMPEKAASKNRKEQKKKYRVNRY